MINSKYYNNLRLNAHLAACKHFERFLPLMYTQRVMITFPKASPDLNR